MKLRAVVLAAVLLAACAAKAKVSPTYSAPPAPRPSSGAAPWAAPADPLARARRAGLSIDRKEFFTFHIHAHLDVFVNGKAVTVPGGLGIDIHDPGVRHVALPGGGTAYGGIELCAKPCIASLHTHQPSGIVHIESAKAQDFTLGQFFTMWGVQLDSSCVGGYCSPDAKVAVFVKGNRYEGNPADIVFANHEEIAVVIGSPPPQVPATYGVPEV